MLVLKGQIMKKLGKQFWMKIHLYLSLFFLPVAFIYALTGALYIFEIRQNSGAKTWNFKLDSMPQKGKEAEVIIQTLLDANLSLPSDTQVRNLRGNVMMGNVKYSATITKDQKGEVTLRVVDRHPYGVLLMMHKSQGNKFALGTYKFTFFDFLAIGFACSLMLFYFSGLVITSFCKKNRRGALYTFLAGLVITSLAVYFSV